MTRRGRLQLVFHGAIFLLIGMLSGIPGFFAANNETLLAEGRLFWRQAHLIPVVTGAWMIGSGAALPHLRLSDFRVSLLVWSLIVSQYAFVVAMAAWGVALFYLKVHVMDSAMMWPYLMPLGITGAGAFIGDILMIVGAHAALQKNDTPPLP